MDMRTTSEHSAAAPRMLGDRGKGAQLTDLVTPASVEHGVKFGVLGTVEAVLDDEPMDVGGPKQRAVLAVLIANAGLRVSTDTIIDEVYGQEPASGARRSVQTYVSNLRRQFGDAITGVPDGYTLQMPRDAVDALQFEDLVDEGRAAIESDPAVAAATLRTALALWRGNPYSDVEQRDLLYPERTRLLELRLSAIEARIEADLALGRHQELVAELEALTEDNPYREGLRAFHMLALYRSGRQSEALRAYQQTRAVLAEELGIDPSPELRELEQKILEQDSSLRFAGSPNVVRRALLVVDIDTQHLAGSVTADDHVSLVLEADTIVTDALADHNGTVFAQRLNATFAAFDTLADALGAATSIAQHVVSLTGDKVKGLVRAAIDVGDVEAAEGGEFTGPVVTRVAGLVGLAHAGQTVMSVAADAEASTQSGWTIRGLGDHKVPYVDQLQPVFQLVIDGADDTFRPLRSDAQAPPIPGGIRAMPGYELRREVQRGHGWVVWQAYQPSVGREVAVRIVSPEQSNEPSFVRRFEMDALAVARLDHPNIVPLYDYWRDLSGAYVVSRWMKGRRLADEIVMDRLDAADTDGLIEHLASALCAAHHIGIVHGAVSPMYVFRDGAGAFLLANFGIGRGVTGASDAATATHIDVEGLRATVEAAAGPSQRVNRFLEESRNASTVDELLDIWKAGSPLEQTEAVPRTEVRNPYRGLSVFTAAHAGNFYGRKRAVHQLVAEMRQRRFVAVVGPSGVGKSSLMQAGLLPALAHGALPGSEEWFTVTMTPGSHPVESLVSALLRSGTTPLPNLDEEVSRDDRGMIRAIQRMFPEGAHVVLLIDQFEELFTLTNDSTVREQFLARLATLIEDTGANAHVMITLRADFFDEPLLHPTLGDLLRESTIPLAAPTADELHDIIESPAAQVGVGYEAGLIAKIISDVEDEPGRLPLLGYALREMFDQRASDVVRFADYEAVGGVLGALGRRAEDITDRLGEPLEPAVRQVFLRLVTMSDTDRPTRRRVRLSELNRLDVDPSAISRTVAAFAEHRLLTLDRDPITRSPTVDVAHEALFEKWPRLAGWIEDRHDDLALRRRLLNAADDWESGGRSDEMLLNLGALTRYEDWVSHTDLSIGPLERDLVAASRQKLDDATRRQTRLRRLVLASISAIAAVAVALAVIATRTADRAQSLAADALVGEAQFLASTGQFEEAALGLVESYNIEQTQNPYTAMSQIINGPQVWGTLIADDQGTTAVKTVVDWDRGVVATAGANEVVPILDAENGRRIGSIVADSPVTNLVFLSDGRLVTGDKDGSVEAWDATTMERVSDGLELGYEISALALAPDDTVIVATVPDENDISVVRSAQLTGSSWNELVTYDVAALLSEPEAEGVRPEVSVRALAVSPDGETLVTTGNPIFAASWSLETGERLAHHIAGGNAGVWSAIFSPNGQFVVTGRQDRRIYVRDATTLEPVGSPSAPNTGQQRSLSFTADGSTLISSGQAGVLLWTFSEKGALGTTPTTVGATTSITTHGHVLSPSGHEVIVSVTDRVRRYNIAPGNTPQPEWPTGFVRAVVTDGTTVWAASQDKGVQSWNRATDEAAVVPIEGERVSTVAYAADGSILFGTRSGMIGRLDGSTVVPLTTHDGLVWAIEWSPDGTRLATASDDGTAVVRDGDTLTTELVLAPKSADAPASVKSVTWVDETTLATTSFDGYLRVWDAVTGQEMFAILIVENEVNAVVAVDNETLAVGDETGKISIVDLPTQRIVRVIEGHTAAVRDLVLSPDGAIVASGGQDNAVRLWTTDTWTEVGLMRHPSAVRAMAFFEEGRKLVAVDIAGRAIVWDTDWTAWPDALCDWLEGWDIEASWPVVMGDARPDPTCSS